MEAITTYRNSSGKFTKGRQETQEEYQKRMESVKKHFDGVLTISKLRQQNPYIYNSWRAMLYTQKGKKAGCSEESWKDYKNFYNDVSSSYIKGLRFCRIDPSKPFSKNNYIWVSDETARQLNRNNLIKLTYNGETLSLKELAVKYNQSISGMSIRYHRHKDTYTTEEIIFGKKTRRGVKQVKDTNPDTYQERVKASKMISSYKAKDKKHGLSSCDIDIDWMIHNILRKPCAYCGDTHKIGCDRIDNNKGHTKDNVVPCCYGCNTVRNNTFTYDEMLILGKTIREIKKARNSNVN